MFLLHIIHSPSNDSQVCDEFRVSVPFEMSGNTVTAEHLGLEEDSFLLYPSQH